MHTPFCSDLAIDAGVRPRQCINIAFGNDIFWAYTAQVYPHQICSKHIDLYMMVFILTQYFHYMLTAKVVYVCIAYNVHWLLLSVCCAWANFSKFINSSNNFIDKHSRSSLSAKYYTCTENIHVQVHHNTAQEVINCRRWRQFQENSNLIAAPLELGSRIDLRSRHNALP